MLGNNTFSINLIIKNVNTEKDALSKHLSSKPVPTKAFMNQFIRCTPRNN